MAKKTTEDIIDYWDNLYRKGLITVSEFFENLGVEIYLLNLSSRDR